jgi:PAS domain S-box-containing protein
MREMIRAIVAPVDADVHECEDAEGALDAYRKWRPQWVTMDIAMHGLDGIAATRAILQSDPAARVVVVTEHMEPALRHAALKAGARAYVLKEDLSELLRVLDPEQSLHMALEASEMRYRSLFDRVPVGLYRSTPDGRIIDANACLVEMLRYPDRESLLAAPAPSLYVDDGERERWQIRMEIERVVRDVEVRLRCHDGAVIWVRHSAGVVFDDRGRVLCYEGAVVDVTEQRRMDSELKASEERYRALYNDTPSMYFTVDAAGTVLSVNEFGASCLGYSPADLIGGSVLRVFFEADREAAVDHVAECFCSPGKVLHWELRKIRRDGTLLWVKETARAVRNREGTVVLIVCEDITERKLTEERLRLSETMAAMGSLVLGVAHEVRNPLHALSGTVDLIEAETEVPEPQRELFEVLRGQVGRLQRLMQDLLEYGRPTPAELRPGSLMDPLVAAVAACASAAARRRVTLVRSEVQHLPPVALDRDRMVQVFTNIVENAIEHSPEGSEVTITMRACAGATAVECLFLDHGPGFTPTDLSRLFAPFYSRRPGGTGLGLSIVQRIVDQHHGQVEALNAPDGGAMIRVVLPAIAAAEDGAIHEP